MMEKLAVGAVEQSTISDLQLNGKITDISIKGTLDNEQLIKCKIERNE